MRRVLVGVGTGVCGASAIASVSGVVEANAREIRYSVSTIFALNLAAVLPFPVLGHLFGMSAHEFGLWRPQPGAATGALAARTM